MQKCKEIHNAREAYRCIFVVCRGFAPAGARRGLSDRPRHPFGAAFLLAGIGICKGFAPAGATKGRSPSGGFPIALWKPSAPTYKLVAFPTLVGRGGSVSCRDHNQAARNRAHLAWAHKPGGKVKPIPSYSSGEGARGRGASLREAASPPEFPHVSPSYSSGEGVWGRGASLREAASPPAVPISCLFEREREGGDFSSEKSPPSQNSLRLIERLFLCVEAGY